jgi:hypothetical protein
VRFNLPPGDGGDGGTSRRRRRALVMQAVAGGLPGDALGPDIFS